MKLQFSSKIQASRLTSGLSELTSKRSEGSLCMLAKEATEVEVLKASGCRVRCCEVSALEEDGLQYK